MLPGMTWRGRAAAPPRFANEHCHSFSGCAPVLASESGILCAPGRFHPPRAQIVALPPHPSHCVPAPGECASEMVRYKAPLPNKNSIQKGGQN